MIEEPRTAKSLAFSSPVFLSADERVVYGDGDATSICVELSPQLAKAEIRDRVVNSMAFILISYLTLRFAKIVYFENNRKFV